MGIKVTIEIEADTTEDVITTLRNAIYDVQDFEMVGSCGVWLAGMSDENASYDISVEWGDGAEGRQWTGDENDSN